MLNRILHAFGVHAIRNTGIYLFMAWDNIQRLNKLRLNKIKVNKIQYSATRTVSKRVIQPCHMQHGHAMINLTKSEESNFNVISLSM